MILTLIPHEEVRLYKLCMQYNEELANCQSGPATAHEVGILTKLCVSLSVKRFCLFKAVTYKWTTLRKYIWICFLTQKPQYQPYQYLQNAYQFIISENLLFLSISHQLNDPGKTCPLFYHNRLLEPIELMSSQSATLLNS